MAQALPMVKKMIFDLVKKATKIPTWVLTSFNDPAVKLVKKTNDVEELKTSLDSLTYGGGDDLKEQALEGNCGLSPLGTWLRFCFWSFRTLSKSKVLFPPRNRGDPRQHAQRWGDPCCHWRRIKTEGAGKIHPKKEPEEKYQNLFFIFSDVSGWLCRFSSGLQTDLKREDVQRVRLHQWELLLHCHQHGL